MKIFSFLSVLFLIFFNSSVFAQCDDVTIESLTNPGPFDVSTLTEDDGLRNGPDYNGATVYYPTNATPPFATIAIVPGFASLPSSVEAWGPFYASHGIVTIIIGTNSLFDFPEARANALLDALETIRQENTRDASPLEGNLDVERFAVSGWSMGGGGAQRAAVLDNSIKGVVALCPYLLNPQLNHESPLLILSGQNDDVAPPSQHADLHYSATPETTDKLLFEVENGDHSVANTPNGGNGIVGRIALSWLKLYVEDDNCYCSLLTDSLLDNPDEASSIETNIECEPLLSIVDNSESFAVYPNPTKNIINIPVKTNMTFEVYSTFGQLLQRGILTESNKQVDLTQLTQGVYYLRIEGITTRVIKN